MTLSDSEVQTVEMLRGGKTPQQIAEVMGVKIRTVRQRIRDSRLKLGAKTTAQLVAMWDSTRK